MSLGPIAAFRVVNWSLNFFACAAWIPAVVPLRKNASIPLCRKLLITCIPYRYTIRNTRFSRASVVTKVSSHSHFIMGLAMIVLSSWIG